MLMVSANVPEDHGASTWSVVVFEVVWRPRQGHDIVGGLPVAMR